MVIYRGAGFFVLLTPLAAVLLLMWFWPDPSVKFGDVSLSQFLLGVSLGAAINTGLGFALNRGPRDSGSYARHHFFFMPMQWPSLAILVTCAVVAMAARI